MRWQSIHHKKKKLKIAEIPEWRTEKIDSIWKHGNYVSANIFYRGLRPAREMHQSIDL